MKYISKLILTIVCLNPHFICAQIQDISGYWEPILTEDFEMRTQGVKKGDFGGIDVNDAGRAAADAYTHDKGEDEWLFRKCGPHGPPRILFTDTRLHIRQDDQAITMELEAEGRTRTFSLTGKSSPATGLTWAGESQAHEDGESLLTVITRNMQPGLLRDNGIPYSDLAVLTEHYTRHDDYFTVIVIVEDPLYLDEPFISSTSFRRIDQPDDWMMGNCNSEK